jgi:hydrogenase/urease accessory protein HupE
VRLAVAVLCGAAAGPAAAHAPLPGLEGVYAGLMHPLTRPDQILVLLAAALFLGGFALGRLAPAFGALAAGLAGGIAIGQAGDEPTPWLFALAALTATVAALAPGRWHPATPVVTAVAGLALGWASVPGPGPPQDRIVTMAGSGAGAGLIVLYATAAIELLRARIRAAWLPIALRVAAAWVAAISLMMLALALEPETETTMPAASRRGAPAELPAASHEGARHETVVEV